MKFSMSLRPSLPLIIKNLCFCISLPNNLANPNEPGMEGHLETMFFTAKAFFVDSPIEKIFLPIHISKFLKFSTDATL